MFVSVKKLKELGASCHDLDEFRAEWPRGGKVTLKNCLRAIELQLDFGWLISVLTNGDIYDQYCDKADEIERKYDVAWQSVWNLSLKTKRRRQVIREASKVCDLAMAKAVCWVLNEQDKKDKGV